MQKEFILERIKAFASENQGQSPGKSTIEKFAGIKDVNWAGKYWVRWNDALEEAGLSQNEMNTAYDSDYVIKHYIEFTRELGKLPVNTELRFKARNDKEFPSHNTFVRHMGNIADRAKFLKNYCKGNADFNDIIAMCNAKISSMPVKPQRQEVDNNSKETVSVGYVYLMKSGKYYKIGFTNSVDRRQYEIGMQLPEKLVPIHSIETDDPSGIEAYWHNRFKDKRLNGEWFDLNARDVTAFKKRKFM